MKNAFYFILEALFVLKIKLHGIIAYCPVFLPNRKTLEKQKLNSSRSTLFHMNTRVSLKYFVNDCNVNFKIYDVRT